MNTTANANADYRNADAAETLMDAAERAGQNERRIALKNAMCLFRQAGNAPRNTKVGRSTAWWSRAAAKRLLNANR